MTVVSVILKLQRFFLVVVAQVQLALLVDQLVQQALQVVQALKVLQVHRVFKAFRESQALQVQQALLVPQVHPPQ
jgi:hypothetical protein